MLSSAHRASSVSYIRIASATGMDPAFHRVVNSHILRFAIAMRVYVRIFGAVTVWWFERTNIYLKFRNLLWQMEEYTIYWTQWTYRIQAEQHLPMCHETDWGIWPVSHKACSWIWSKGATNVIISIINKRWGRSDLIMAKFQNYSICTIC